MPPEELANLLKNLGLADIINLNVGPVLAQGFDIVDGSKFSGILGMVKTIAVILILIFIVLITLTIYKLVVFNKTLREKPQLLKPAPLLSKWQEIENHSKSLQEVQWKFAIIEADSLVNDVVKKLGYPGESLGERMQFIKRDEVSGLENLWRAHRLRNRLVHESNYELRREEMEEAIRSYELVLKELGAI